MSKKTMVLGVGGMDGSHLTEQLLADGRTVVGVYRRSSVDNLARVAHLRDNTRLVLMQADLTDTAAVSGLLAGVRPDELYNMADMDHVAASTASPGYSLDVTGAAVGRLLEAVLAHTPATRVFLPVSALVFGRTWPPQHEGSPLDPLSPYACAKALVLHLARYHRTVNKLWVTVGIYFNHDSTSRSPHYLAHELARKALAVARGAATAVEVGDPEMHVSMGLAEEFMSITRRLMELDAPGDFCVGSPRSYSIGCLASHALRRAGLDGPNLSDKVKANRMLLRNGPQPTLFPREEGKLFTEAGRSPRHDALDVMDMLVDHYRGATEVHK